MESLLKDKMSAPDAQHIWSMLDNMAQTDPKAYKRFIDKQMEDGRKAMSPPKPHMCIQTKLIVR